MIEIIMICRDETINLLIAFQFLLLYSAEIYSNKSYKSLLLIGIKRK